jgi:hypothetical protein
MTVGKWHSRLVAQRLNGLVDEDRPDWPSSTTLDNFQEAIVTTLG